VDVSIAYVVKPGFSISGSTFIGVQYESINCPI
jgi:hypothetical protein